MNWQPISTAPKDGTDILLLTEAKSKPRIWMGYWNHDYAGWNQRVASSWLGPWPICIMSPTHWMLLPELPK